MIEGNLSINAVGPVRCGLCPEKRDEQDKIIEKDGIVLQADNAEYPLCWKHVRAFVSMRATAKPKREPATPQFPAMSEAG